MIATATRTKLRHGLALLPFCALLTLVPITAAVPDFTGTWVGTTEAPDVGSIQVTLVVRRTDANHSAVLSDSALLIAPDTEARDLKIDGDTISFWFPLASAETVSVQLTIAGDTMSGGWQHESGATGSLRFERTK